MSLMMLIENTCAYWDARSTSGLSVFLNFSERASANSAQIQQNIQPIQLSFVLARVSKSIWLETTLATAKTNCQKRTLSFCNTCAELASFVYK